LRKDYVESTSPDGEDAFVATMWDRVWQEHASDGVPRESLRAGEEYQFLRGHVLSRAAGPLDVLDCGCGTGNWTLLLREDGHRATGIDIAPRSIERLRQEHGETFRVGDFRRTGLPADSFDLVINWGGLEHFEEGPAAGIAEAWRVLRPGGALVATTPFHNLRLRILDRWRTRSGAPRGPLGTSRFYQYRFTRPELEDAFRAAGFDRVESRPVGGQQGMTRAFQHELAGLGKRLPRAAQAVLISLGGRVLRPWLGHMAICIGRKSPGT
jgi:SAM-dependent methyltransferase